MLHKPEFLEGNRMEKLCLFWAFLFATLTLHGQQTAEPKPNPQMPEMDHSKMAGMDHSQMPGMQYAMDINEAGMLLMNQASGTSMNPKSWPMPMVMKKLGSWHAMFMANAFIVDTQQSGPRGYDKIYSPN